METNGTNGDMAAVVEKIRKLLRLAGSDNPHEAALAAARAQELLDKYNLDLAVIEDAGGAPQSEVDIEAIVLSGQSTRWQGIIADGLAKTSYCKVWYVGGTRMHKMSLLGSATNRAAVIEVHGWLLEQVEKLARLQPRIGRSSFCLGAATMIRQRLIDEHRARQAVASDCRALVVRHDQRNKEWMRDHNIRLQSTSRSQAANWQAYHAGKKAGAGVSLTPQRKLDPARASQLRLS